MKSMKYKANLLLGMTLFICLVSFPYRHTLGGGLLCAVASAALAGGLADWFAVTALFRKPLGFPWHTAMIPRKREQMFRAFSAMVQDDLLTGSNMAKTLHRYDTTAVVLEYLYEQDGKRQIEKLLHLTVLELARQGKGRQTMYLLNQLVKKNLAVISLSEPLLMGISSLLRRKYDAAVVVFVLEEISRLIRQPQFLSMLLPLLIQVQQSYEKEKVRRKVFDQLFQLSAEQAGRAIQRELTALLEAMQQPDHPARRLLHRWLRQKMRQVRNDQNLRRQLDDWLKERLNESRLGERLFPAVRRFFQAAETERQQLLRELGRLSRYLERMLDEFAGNAVARAAVDQMAKRVLCRLVERHGAEIGRLIKNRLEQFSNEWLINFIEDKVGHDLQMIRINGSLVGGLAGGMIFLIDRAMDFF